MFALVGVAYAAFAELSWRFFGATIGITFFPAAGVTVAAMLLTRRSRWPGLVAATVLAEILVDLQNGLSLPYAAAYAAANAVEPLVGAFAVLRLCGGKPDLRRRGNLIYFVAGASIIGPLAGALIGGPTAALSARSWWPGDILQWWAGDGVAVLVVGIPLLLWPLRRELLRARRADLALLIALTAVISVAIMLGDLPVTPFLLPVLAWAAFRLGDVGVVACGATFAFAANYLTAVGRGQFALLPLGVAAIRAGLQAYIAVVVLISVVMAQEISGRLGAIEDERVALTERDRASARQAAAEVGTVIADATTVADVTDLVVVSVRERLGADHAVISILGEDQHEAVPQPAKAVSGSAAVSVAGMPLLTGAGRPGYLDVRWSRPHQFTVPERDYLEAVAEVASRGMERAWTRQYEQLERQRLQGLADLTRALSAALTPEDVGHIVTEQVRADTGAHCVMLGIVSDDGRGMDWIATSGCPDCACGITFLPLTAQTMATDAARTGKPVVIATSQEYKERYPDAADAAVQLSPETRLSWPLQAGEDTIGVLSFVWTKAQPLDASQLAFASTIARLVAQALARARRFADEHAIAAVLQDAVMPKAMAGIPGIDLATCYLPAGSGRGMGGDWYDAMPLPGGGIYLAVGDVVGHGLAAVKDMAQLRNAGRTLAVEGHPPGRLLAELTKVTGHVTHGKFATMAVAMIHPGECSVTYGSAGHPPMLIRCARTGKVTRLTDAAGPVLGAIGGSGYTQGHASLDPDDILLMFTDGLVERRGDHIDRGIANVERRLAEWPGEAPLAAFCGELAAALVPQPHDDDVCVLAVTLLGHPYRTSGLRYEPASGGGRSDGG